MRTSKSSLFLMELIVALLFFSISAGICVQLFVAAHTTDSSTINNNYAAVWSQNLAESFEGCKGDIKAIHTVWNGYNLAPYISDILNPEYKLANTDAESMIALGFDSNYNEVASHAPCDYIAILSVSSDDAPKDIDQGGYMLNGNITVIDNNKGIELYSLQVKHYVPLKGGAHAE